MAFMDKWNKAVKNTKVLRWRKSHLATFDNTVLKYAFLGESAVNNGDTVHRKGKLVVHKPLLLLPENVPQFEGFDMLKELGVTEEDLAKFLLIRGVSFPSLKFRHEADSLGIVEKDVEETSKQVLSALDKESNLDTGVLIGPEDCWQLSVIIYAGGLMARSASRDIERMFD